MYNVFTENKIVFFKTLTNSNRRNKGYFMSKSNSNKIKLCGVGVQHYFVLNKISTLYFHFLGLLQFLSELKKIPRKRLNNIYFSC